MSIKKINSLKHDESISVIGLGKLGLPLAICFASKKIKVYGLDNNLDLLTKLKNGLYNYYEPDLNGYLKRNRDLIYYTESYQEIVEQTDITFIVVPTPSKKNGLFSLEYLLDAIKKIGAALKRKEKEHLIIITSTVNPLSMSNFVVPALEKYSGKKIGNQKIDICYSPEFIALGSVIKNLTNPDFILIGTENKRSGKILSNIRSCICKNNPPIVKMNYINAELTKLSLNAYITTKITFANELARLCERVPNANVDIITSAMGLDKRIGPKYLKGSVAFGGPCFPRDNLALTAFSESLGSSFPTAKSVHEYNQKQINFLVNLVIKNIKKGQTVGILGLSYKPNTDVTEKSAGMELLRSFKKNGVRTISYDPSIKFGNDLKKTIRNSDLIVITTPWKEFAQADLYHGKTVIDCWRILKEGKNIKFSLIQLGIGK